MDKKIAVITLHRVYNYGSALQAYATQEILKRYSSNVQIIDYRRHQDVLKNRIIETDWVNAPTIKSKLRKGGYLCARFVSIVVKEATIGRFLRKHLIMTREYRSYNELVADTPEADIYITGSDQTWNSVYNNGVDPAYYLQFVDNNKKRFSFCASLGRTDISEEEKKITYEYLKYYNGISVREKSAEQLLKQIGFKHVTRLIDPTLQLCADNWKAIASPRLVKQKYLLLMILYNEDNDATMMARKIADEKGLKVVKISWEHRRPKDVDILMTHKTPEDFLSLFYYADFVVTNSFHGLCFALNFNKQFIAVKRDEFNTRLDGLLELVHLSHRMVTINKCIQISSQIIDYQDINKIIDNERNKANDFLANQIGE